MTDPTPETTAGYPMPDPTDPNYVAPEQLREMMAQGLDEAALRHVREVAEGFEPNLLVLYALVDIPGKGIALVGSSRLDESIDIFGVLKEVVSLQPIGHIAGVHEADGGPFRTATGKVLTDADVEALADEAERGYTEDQS